MTRTIKSLRSRLPKILLLASIGVFGMSSLAHASAPAAPEPGSPQVTCQKGEFCVWTEEHYGGELERMDLRTVNPEECVPLLADFTAYSFVNRMDRMVSVYQGEDCSTEGDFTTYPGGGTYVPQAPFTVRAIQVWN
ncbi:peptidase inhibitor family I36 protein [Amycolatopsis magusensis]|uniref:peptidase inhibitor family I36 protein n=1 Tax=Amycolatopsis magusensis TaxID=882444 RepID=UPI0024A9BB7A|nr:peptidase inhibitor family I36 protein [Amycolatopsis magusensis]MDI5982411.1 peptidase inhibitor family I36 protein [Amycolatopsis magusensis]